VKNEGLGSELNKGVLLGLILVRLPAERLWQRDSDDSRKLMRLNAYLGQEHRGATLGGLLFGFDTVVISTVTHAQPQAAG